MANYASLPSSETVAFITDYAPNIAGSSWGVLAGIAADSAISTIKKNKPGYLLSRGDHYMFEAILLIHTHNRVFTDSDRIHLRQRWRQGIRAKKAIETEGQTLSFVRLYFKKRDYKNVMKIFFLETKKVSARAMAKLAGFNSVESLPMVQPSSPSPSNTGRNDGTPPADPAAKTAAADSPSSELPPAHDTEVEASDIETGGIPMEILTNNSPEELIQAFSEMMPNITPLRIETNLTPDELPIRLADIPEDNDIDGEFQREISSQISTSNKVDDNTTVPTSLTAEVLPAESQVPVGTSPAIEEGLY